ncbi:type I restriction-modification system subunit M [Vagococcus bubulae]|uniref:site-specific DNA-methyltransferase (adenine-specific) n=1 Tax=Vagococcus bubulae TaxID=1977868 RepID=A0A429ZQA1_9ENTE|nr:type I restriction-modification system subunit M [Vagococcus bubulae]RST95838.1 type I restriction-modification system subunit M [Vagococcus bubulae]
MEKNLTKQFISTTETLRTKMDASEYKNYILGLIVYKYLSDKLLLEVVEQSGEELTDYSTKDKQTTLYKKLLEDNEIKEDLLQELLNELSYVIEPNYLFNVLAEQARTETLKLDDLREALINISNSNPFFFGLFDDVDLSSRKLGNDEEQQLLIISDILIKLNEIDMMNHDIKSIGLAFDSLIDKFSLDSGKRVEDFFTPISISGILARIVTMGHTNKQEFSIYDPVMGSGSLLLKVGNSIHPSTRVKYYGQELNATTFNLARMNFIMHGIDMKQAVLNNGDTLNKDWPITEPKTFDSVVMNPPYSAKWSADKSFLSDSRFSEFDKLAPKSKADFAFLLHGLYHLKDNGTMAIILPHGVLFRGAAEGDIRKKLLEDGNIEAVIGMPSNLFYGTSIPTTIIVLKKNRLEKDVLFIDASREFEKEKLQNKLTKENVDKIIDTYREKKIIDRYSYIASFDEIKGNDYNLNIPRYVDTFEEVAPLDIKAVSNELKEINAKKQELNQKMSAMIHSLDDRYLVDSNVKAIIELLNK